MKISNKIEVECSAEELLAIIKKYIDLGHYLNTAFILKIKDYPIKYILTFKKEKKEDE